MAAIAMDLLLPVVVVLLLVWTTSDFSSFVAADEILGCGGFVQASSGLSKSRKQSDAKLDFSDVTVELCTSDGLVKEKTQCSPNGYYFMPVYDKGSFILRVRGPTGWSWKPETVPVVIDENGCNMNEDINFQFTGFMISGRVVGAVGGESCSSKNKGPSDVKIELLSTSNELILSVLTSQSGKYAFPNIFPGRYILRASHPDFEVEIKGSTELDLGFGNAVVDDIFSVTGYNIYGSVVAEGNPVLGVHFYLYSEDVSELRCPQDFGTAPREGARCHATSDADGKFTFRSMPCGVYEIVPYYKGENTIFDVSPTSLTVSVQQNHAVVPQKFQVTGFSIGGRVVDHRSNGIDGAKIFVDGKLKAVTDNHGFYKLDQVTSKHYNIVAEKEHYKFTPLTNFLILPNRASLDDIKAARFDLCGSVHLVSADLKVMVALTHGSENEKPQKMRADKNGNFCFEVPSGEYRLSAVATDSETASAIVFSPSFVDVAVDRPVLDIGFSQSQVNILGKVLCKEKCGLDISVSLARLVGGAPRERASIALEDESGDFSFSKVLPGKYRLEIKHVSGSWCWERSSLDVDVGNEDVSGVVFIQRGYWVVVDSSHDTEAYIMHSDSSRLDLPLKKGSQNICIEVPGEHELHVVNSCVHFGKSVFTFNTWNSMHLFIKGEKYLLKGEVRLDSGGNPDLRDLSREIVIDAFDGNRKFLETLQVSPASDDAMTAANKVAAYQYFIWADLGSQFVFMPRDSSNERENKYLFYPSQCGFSVSKMECQDIAPAMLGRVGMYVEGSVSPPTPGVNIKVIAAGRSVYAPLKIGDLAFETVTGDDGSYKAGPLYDDITYTIEASKPGYNLRQTGPHSFSCQKLGRILVHIDSEVGAQPFPPVLFSLSGEHGYRNNSISSHGGSFSFDNLFPGNFYLRPVLKEYSFSPSSAAINLESGQSQAVKFRATRVAYSAMGSVTLLSGQPKEGVFIEARAEAKGYYEEATTDKLGNFRLKGLLPDTTYSIRALSKQHVSAVGIERCSPESISIHVGLEDINGVSFIVFEQPETTILSGHVEGADLDTLQPHLSVEVRLAGDPSRVESIFPLPLSGYFEVRDLPRVRHLLQLRSGMLSTTHSFNAEAVEVDLGSRPHAHVGPLQYGIEERHHKQELTPAPVFPLIVGACLFALLRSMPRLQELYQSAVGRSQVSSTPASSTTKKELRKKRA